MRTIKALALALAAGAPLAILPAMAAGTDPATTTTNQNSSGAQWRSGAPSADMTLNGVPNTPGGPATRGNAAGGGEAGGAGSGGGGAGSAH